MRMLGWWWSRTIREFGTGHQRQARRYIIVCWHGRLIGQAGQGLRCCQTEVDSDRRSWWWWEQSCRSCAGGLPACASSLRPCLTKPPVKIMLISEMVRSKCVSNDFTTKSMKFYIAFLPSRTSESFMKYTNGLGTSIECAVIFVANLCCRSYKVPFLMRLLPC